MIRLATIVEGDGEVKAVPVLLRRLGERIRPGLPLEVLRPIRVGRQKVVKEALTAVFDLDTARAAPSFDKLWREVATLLAD